MKDAVAHYCQEAAMERQTNRYEPEATEAYLDEARFYSELLA